LRNRTVQARSRGRRACVCHSRPSSSSAPEVILTVTLNMALDVTYHVERFERGQTARVRDVARRAGGKGVNVARVLHELGHDVVVTGLAGGFTSEAARAELKAAGLRDELVEIAGQSRLTLVVVDREGSATGFWEPGPVVAAREWEAAYGRCSELLASASVVVLAGSLPAGVPADAYARLIGAATDAGVPTLLDAEGKALAVGAAAGPAVVKVNVSELASTTGEHEVEAGSRVLRSAGARAVVITDGAAGLTCFADEVVLHAVAPEVLGGNPTGAGDAVSAALAVGMTEDVPWPERLADAAALSAAAVGAAQAGSFDLDVYRRLRTTVQAVAV
jgi:tagatose 6-phosphate kinase